MRLVVDSSCISDALEPGAVCVPVAVGAECGKREGCHGLNVGLAVELAQVDDELLAFVDFEGG